MVSWVNDIMALGHPEDVKQIEEDLKNAFACKSEGYLKEYVGSKVDFTQDETGLGTIKITQPVLVQKLAESFDVAGGRNPKTPAIAGQVLVRGDGSNTYAWAKRNNEIQVRYSHMPVYDPMVEA